MPLGQLAYPSGAIAPLQQPAHRVLMAVDHQLDITHDTDMQQMTQG
jgi:hypothetical protein